MKIRAAQATTPDDDNEKVIVFAPGRKSRASYGIILDMSSGPRHETYQLLGCEPERLRVLNFSSSGKRWMHTSPQLWGRCR